MSYYQIAGIYGLPKELWDGVVGLGSKAESIENDGQGYCAHGTITFPTWHRPYLSMIEQTLYLRMVDKAEKFPEANRQTYRTAAQKFRLPYWDYYWPRPRSSPSDYDFAIPQVLVADQLMVRTTARNELEPLPNPLRSFAFPTGKPTADEWKIAGAYDPSRTKRHPFTGKREGKPLTSVQDLNIALNGDRDDKTEYLVDLMTNYRHYSSFGSAQAGDGGPRSLEAIHGAYHIHTGGVGGHMSEVLVAAFDPLFWFHHCQIDRWLALWQASHPIEWFRGSESSQEKENLYPFRASKVGGSETFWNSDGDISAARSSRSTETFGYNYLGAKGDPSIVLHDFLQQYNWSARLVSGVRPQPPKGWEILDVSKAQVFRKSDHVPTFNSGPAPGVQKVVSSAIHSVKTAALGSDSTGVGNTAGRQATEEVTGTSEAAPPHPQIPPALTVPQTTFSGVEDLEKSKISRMWSTDHVVERLALNGAFTIYYFLGSFDSGHPYTYMTQEHMAGLSHNFAAPVEACDNCGRQEEQAHLVSDGTPITSTLLGYVDSGELPNLDPEHIKSFLVKHLQWRVATARGDPVDPRTVRGLKLNVSCRSMPIPPATHPDPPMREEYPEIIEQIIANSS